MITRKAGIIIIASILISTIVNAAKYTKEQIAMANTYTNHLLLAKPAAGDLGWQDEFYRNKYILSAVDWQKLQRNYIISGGVLSDAGGLTLAYTAIESYVGGLEFVTPLGSILLNDDSFNLIYVNDAGVVIVSNVEITADDYVLLGIAETAAGDIVNFKSLRVVDKPPVVKCPAITIPILGNIAGLLLSNSSDINHDITVGPGRAINSSGHVELSLSSAITKRLDASWSEGTNQGGLLNGSIGPNRLYHVFLMKKSGGNVDIGFLRDGEDLESYLPTDYNWYRWIGWIITNSSSDIIEFTMNQKYMHYSEDIQIFNGTLYGSNTLIDLSSKMPVGYGVAAKFGSTISSPNNTYLSTDGKAVSGMCLTFGGVDPSLPSMTLLRACDFIPIVNSQVYAIGGILTTLNLLEVEFVR